MVSQVQLVAVITTVFSALSFLAVALRLFARCFIMKAMGPDDYLIVLASLFSWAYAVVTIIAVRHALAGNLLLLTLKEQQTFLMGMYLASMFYPASQGFTKLSICWFYTRLGHVTLTRVCYGVIALVVAQTVGVVLSAALHCPPAKWFHSPVLLLLCAPHIEAFALASGTINVVTDVVTYVLPIPVIRILQMPFKQKAYVIIILALGVIPCIASIVRLAYNSNLMRFPPDYNTISATFYWTAVETNLSIVAASIPSFKAIATRYFPRAIGTDPSGSRSEQSGRPRPLESGSVDELYRLKPFRRRTRTLGLSVLYDRDRGGMGTSIPTLSQERIHVPETTTVTPK
ncbi:hypothetical protein BDV28DRAFT_114374 [Aspergillus coremiiformis]|uniref:Rhodopsin domain-containing protein n=1 Tax=Aspergillus coremiiformis TaxID=138285 RepID=A0A5N6Z877_9EURO|nr:hypothetical protein BDV28DRAFT_114374 [Aspergillus coremiiformis]